MTVKECKFFYHLIALLPDAQAIEVHEGALWIINVTDPAEARAFFPRAVWSKSREEPFDWWWYQATMPGGAKVKFNTYVAPASCRAVVEEYEVTEQVPTVFEEKVVVKKRTRWECGPEVVAS